MQRCDVRTYRNTYLYQATYFFQLVFRCHGRDLILLENCVQRKNAFAVHLILFLKCPVAFFYQVDHWNKHLCYVFLQFNGLSVKGSLK
jgi:hypothetical protein